MSGAPSPWAEARGEIVRAVGALVVALAVAFVIIMFTSKAPLEAFATLLRSPLTSQRTIGYWIDDSAKLTMTGLALSLVFQARQFSLGVQGQVLLGGLCSGVVALSPVGYTWAAIPLGILAAMAAGAAYGFIPGYAKAKLGANEIVSSLMLNYIALDLTTWLIRDKLAPPGKGLLFTNPFPKIAVFPALVAHTRIDLGVILAVIAVIATWFALYRTSWGLKLRLVGHNPRFAEYAGIRANFIMVSAMTVSGAIAGLLGAMFVQGQVYGKLATNFENGLAFEGILVAIVARNRPLAIPFVALGYGYLRQGANLMNIRTDVPNEVIAVVQAIIILLVASTFALPVRKWLMRLRPEARRAAEAAERVGP